MDLPSRDEHDHLAGPSSAWSETWEYRAMSADLSVAVVAAVVRRPAVAQMSYWTAVIGRGRPTVALVDHEIDPPRVGLELRATGLWADHVCEEPHRRWSLGLEAFGLALDDPRDLVTTGRGLPVPLGFDLEVETDAPPTPLEAPDDAGYLAAGVAAGEVLVGEATLRLEGPGHRLHRWGNGPAFPVWWATEAEAGAGEPSWVLAELGSALVSDTLGAVTEVRVGQVLHEEGPSGPAWCSTRFAAEEF